MIRSADLMDNDYRTKRGEKKRSAKWIFIGTAVIILAALAWFVAGAKKEAETEKEFTFESNSQRVEYLNTCGYIVEPEPESKDITIPAEFNAAYTEYNELQRSQGFDLLAYAGKEVTMYTYKILNYPDITDNVVVNLLFDDHLMIGADITFNDAENGFTKPLIQDTIQSASLPHKV